MLKAIGLQYHAGGKAIVNGIDLAVAPGQFFSIVGPNGAGKTTLLRLLSGALRAKSGTIRIGGEDLSALKPRDLAQRRAYFEQHNSSGFPFLVSEVVALGRQPHDLTRKLRLHGQSLVVEAMARAGVAHLAQRRFSTLSGGEATRVHLARVLAQDTALVFLDEPTNHLDLAHQMELLDVFKELTREGKTVVAVLHDLNLAALYSDAMALLHQGQRVAQGAPEQVLNPALLQSVFGLECTVQSHPDGTPWIVPLRSTLQEHRAAASQATQPEFETKVIESIS